MTAFMYYVNRVDLMLVLYKRDTDRGFIEYAYDEMKRDLEAAELNEMITPYQRAKLLQRLEEMF